MKKTASDPVALSQRVVDDNRNLIERLSSDLDSARSELLVEQDRARRLQHQTEAAEAAASAARRERDELLSGLDRFRRDGEKKTAQITTIESQNTHLANLYVACYRLLGTLDRAEVIDAIKDVVINIVGSEDFAIIEARPGETPWTVIGEFGGRVGVGTDIHAESEPVIQSLASGQPFVAPHGDGLVVACVPFRLDGRVTGAIIIFGLLQQKARIEATDLEMLDLLSSHAANALHFTSLHQKSLHEA